MSDHSTPPVTDEQIEAFRKNLLPSGNPLRATPGVDFRSLLARIDAERERAEKAEAENKRLHSWLWSLVQNVKSGRIVRRLKREWTRSPWDLCELLGVGSTTAHDLWRRHADADIPPPISRSGGSEHESH